MEISVPISALVKSEIGFSRIPSATKSDNTGSGAKPWAKINFSKISMKLSNKINIFSIYIYNI